METQVWVTRNWQNLGVRPMMCKVFEEQGVFPRTMAETTTGRTTAFTLGIDFFLTESEARASVEEERLTRIKELEAELSALKAMKF